MPYQPLPGYVWNPFKAYPRNERCFCVSGKKAKHCCLPKLAPAVPKELAEKLEPIMKLVKQAEKAKG